MSDERRSGGGGIGAGFVLLLFVGAVAKFWIWIVAGLAGCALFVLGAHLIYRADKQRAAELERLAAIVARCDEQHAQLLAGDPRGMYGIFPPAVPPEPPPIPEPLTVAGENWGRLPRRTATKSPRQLVDTAFTADSKRPN